MDRADSKSVPSSLSRMSLTCSATGDVGPTSEAVHGHQDLLDSASPVSGGRLVEAALLYCYHHLRIVRRDHAELRRVQPASEEGARALRNDCRFGGIASRAVAAGLEAGTRSQCVRVQEDHSAVRLEERTQEACG